MNLTTLLIPTWCPKCRANPQSVTIPYIKPLVTMGVGSLLPDDKHKEKTVTCHDCKHKYSFSIVTKDNLVIGLAQKDL